MVKRELKTGTLDEAVQVLRAPAGAGDNYAARRLAELLAERGDLDEAVQVLHIPADAGDEEAAEQLADLLAGRGDLDGLRARVGAGDGEAARRLAELLAGRGDLDGLLAQANAGYGDTFLLTLLLIKQHRREDAGRLRRFGLNLDGSIASA